MRRGYKTVWEEQYQDIPEEFVSILERKSQKYVQVQGNSSPSHLQDQIYSVSEEEAKTLMNGGRINWHSDIQCEIISKEEIEKERKQIEEDGEENERFEQGMEK